MRRAGETRTRGTTLTSLTAVIPNWETAEYTVRCAEALMGDGVPAGRIVVVDNGSQDDSAAQIQKQLPGCVLLEIDENIGYGNAVHAGVRALPGDAYLAVNSDAFVHRPGSLARLVAALDRPDVGIAVPRLLNEDLSLQRNVVPPATPATALVRASGLSRLVPDRWQPRWATHWSHSTSREIAAADGAVFLVRASAWDALGGFDESIYMYAEDLELCWRARALGWKVWFVADAEFIHVGTGTTKRKWRNDRRAELVARSESHAIARHLPPRAARLTLAVMRAGLLARLAVYRAARDSEAVGDLRASWRGYAWPGAAPSTASGRPGARAGAADVAASPPAEEPGARPGDVVPAEGRRDP